MGQLVRLWMDSVFLFDSVSPFLKYFIILAYIYGDQEFEQYVGTSLILFQWILQSQFLSDATAVSHELRLSRKGKSCLLCVDTIFP